MENFPFKSHQHEGLPNDYIDPKSILRYRYFGPHIRFQRVTAVSSRSLIFREGHLPYDETMDLKNLQMLYSLNNILHEESITLI